MNAEHIDASGEVLQARDADRAFRARAARDERIQERRHVNDLVRVSINAPHKAAVNGNNIALTIEGVGGQAGAGGDTIETVLCEAGVATRVNLVFRGPKQVLS